MGDTGVAEEGMGGDTGAAEERMGDTGVVGVDGSCCFLCLPSLALNQVLRCIVARRAAKYHRDGWSGCEYTFAEVLLIVYKRGRERPTVRFMLP
jgi:hypothetical protein